MRQIIHCGRNPFNEDPHMRDSQKSPPAMQKQKSAPRERTRAIILRTVKTYIWWTGLALMIQRYVLLSVYKAIFFHTQSQNPQNWSSSWKFLVSFQICFINFSVYMGSSIYVPGEPSIMRDFGSSETVATLGLSLFTL
jgi:hypothetical protein